MMPAWTSAPTHELTRAQAVLRARRRIAAEAPDWALSAEGLTALRGGPESRAEEGDEGRGEGSEDAEPERLGAGAGAGPLRAERAALGRALAKSTRVLAGDKAATDALSDWFLDDPDEEDERLEAWRSAAAAASSDPPCLAAALLWDAWEQNPPLERQAWLGNLLVSAFFRAREKTKSHLFPLSSALRLIRREKRRSPDRTARLAAFLEAVAAGAQASLKEDDRLLLVRQSFEAKLKKKRGPSRLPALVDLILARPIASAGMIAAALSVTPRAAQAMVKELGLQAMTAPSPT